MTVPQLSIIILNWNSVRYLGACIDSIKGQTCGISYEIIVADGASFDGSEQFVAENYPEVTFFQLNENGGFAKGNNKAARLARGEVLLFLNPDTVVNEKAVENLYREFLNLPNVGIAGTRLLNSDGSLQTSGVQAFPSIWNQVLDFDFLVRKLRTFPLWGNKALYRNVAAKVEVVSGACLMIRRQLFEQVGGFNEQYFMYAEDAHICWEVRKAGKDVCYLPAGCVTHHGGGSSLGKPSAFSSKTFRHSVYLFLRDTRGRFYAESYRYSMLGCAAARLALLYAASLFKPSAVQNSISKWRHVAAWARSCQIS